MDDFDRQINLNRAIIENLNIFQRRLDELNDLYIQQLRYAENSGFMKNYIDVLGGERAQRLSMQIDRIKSTAQRGIDEANDQVDELTIVRDRSKGE